MSSQDAFERGFRYPDKKGYACVSTFSRWKRAADSGLDNVSVASFVFVSFLSRFPPSDVPTGHSMHTFLVPDTQPPPSHLVPSPNELLNRRHTLDPSIPLCEKRDTDITCRLKSVLFVRKGVRLTGKPMCKQDSWMYTASTRRARLKVKRAASKGHRRNAGEIIREYRRESQ